MASQMNISFMVNATGTNPVPHRARMSVASLLNNTTTYPDGKWERTEADMVWRRIHYASNLHNQTSNEEKPFRGLIQPLNGSKFSQKSYFRRAAGPDFPYLPIPYSDIDGLGYRLSDGPDPLVGAIIQGSKQNITNSQAANSQIYTANEGAYQADRRRNDEHVRCLPPLPFMGTEAQNDPAMLSQDTSSVTINKNPTLTSFEAFLYSSPRQSSQSSLADAVRGHRPLFPSTIRNEIQTLFMQTMRTIDVEKLDRPSRQPNNFESKRDFDNFISNATRQELGSYLSHPQCQNIKPIQAVPKADMGLPTPQSALPSSKSIYQPNGNVHVRGGDSSFCHYAFIDTPPATPIEDMQLSLSKPTGIYDPVNIRTNKKRKLDQMAAGLDDFQLPVEPSEGFVIDSVTGRERKRRITDDFSMSQGRRLDEQRRLKRIYEEERAEREECNDSDPSTSSSEDNIMLNRPPPGYKIDYFTKKVRKLRLNESRAFLRRQYDRMIEKPVEMREWGYWEEGDSELDLSEWERANKKLERKRRARKAFRRRILRLAERKQAIDCFDSD